MKGCLKWGAIAFVALLVLGVIGAALSGGTETPPTTIEEVAQQTAAETGVSREEAEPTERPEPTGTPAPTSTPKPTPTLTEVPVGLSRENPVPAGQAFQVGDWAIVVAGSVRGAEALQRIKNDNMFNSDPRPGYEYLIVAVSGTYLGEGTGILSPISFRATGSSKKIHEPELVVLNEGLGTTEVFTEGTVEGLIPFQVEQGEESLVLIYDPGLGTAAIYFEIP